MEGYESSAVMGERCVFVINVKLYLLALARFAHEGVCACVCVTDISPCIFPRLERETEYSKTIVNSLQKYIGSLIDIYMKVNE